MSVAMTPASPAPAAAEATTVVTADPVGAARTLSTRFDEIDVLRDLPRPADPSDLRQVLDAAKEHDVFVRLDMEGTDLTDSTLAMFEAVYPDYPRHVGPVLQAMLKRTADDIDRMCELGASVRLCKGAYKEPSALAYQDMDTIRTRYIEYMQQLITEARYPGIATHDDRLIDATKRFVAENDISTDDFEFQMLYGVRPETQREMVRDGYNMMVYVPYGTEWLPYFSRRLRERKENVWFILKNLFRK